MKRSDVYNKYSSRQRTLIIITCSLIAALTPFTDTIYLPALRSIGIDLNAQDATVALSVSIYLASVGVGQLIWGILSDRFGRLVILFGSLFVYEIFSLLCIFANSIEILIFERSIQGFVVGSTIITAQAIITDVYPPSIRGAALGAVLAPMLLGPIIAPLIGGVLCQFFGWRSTFMFLSVLNIVTIFFAILSLPETHHWIILQKEIKNSAQNLEEVIVQPELDSPIGILLLLFDPELSLTFILNGINFAAMFTSLTILPVYLSQSPYNLSQAIIGVVFLPVGVAMMLGAIVGGKLSDFSAVLYPSQTEGRVVLPSLLSFSLPFGTIAFGLCLHYQTNLAGVLLTQCVLGFGQAVLMPGTMAYLSEKRPAKTGSTGAALFFVCFGGAAIFVSFSLIISSAIGVHFFFLILSGASFISFVAIYPQYSAALQRTKTTIFDDSSPSNIDLIDNNNNNNIDKAHKLENRMSLSLDLRNESKDEISSYNLEISTL